MRCLFLASLALAGCGGVAETTGPKPFPVRGTVVHGGRPAAGVQVVLHPLPLAATNRFLPSALSDQDGRFRMGSYTAGDGAPAGEYAVTLTWPAPRDASDDDSVNPPDLLEGRFANPQTSTLKVSIHAGDNALDPITID